MEIMKGLPSPSLQPSALTMKKSYLVLGVVVATITLGWLWLERSTRPAGDVVPNLPGSTTAGGPVSPPPVPTLGDLPPLPPESTLNANPDMQAEALAPDEPPGPPPLPTAGDILADPDEDYVRVAKKLAVLVRDSRLPMADREEALAHTLNLSAGNEAEVLTPLVTDSSLPDSLAETILAEALNRPLAFQADLYLAALPKRKSPEMQKLIREHLAFLTSGEDLGDDPKNWIPALTLAKKDWE